jgi:hypothetical protein
MTEDPKTLNAIIGLVAVGSSVTGVGSLIAALVAFLSGELTAAGMCLMAAALSFGLLANALLRD